MEISGEGLENQLLEAGNKLLSPPASSTELLASLAVVENLLGGVEQSPTMSMKEALAPSTEALVAKELLRHSNADVKVAVASCISEITRITAPDAPYADNQMKEIFQLIVSSFEKLDDKSSLSYARRTSILETLAKVRSCVVMLDLECDELIVDMFRHFFRTIRDDHNEGVLSSMETIMTLVVEESEEISSDLLLSILEVLRKENNKILPIACQLGEKVIGNCGSKLKPYLLQALRSSGASLNDYSKVVADVCQAVDEAVQPADGDSPNEKVAMEEDRPPSEEVGSSVVGSPSTVMSNGFLQKCNDNTNVVTDNPETADLGMHEEKTETISDAVVLEEPLKPKTTPEKPNNLSVPIDNSKEANLNEQGEKAEPSETISVGVGSEEPLKTQPAKTSTSAANDNSKGADLYMQDENAEASETIADTVVSEEQPGSKTIPEKPNNSSEANGDSKEADLGIVDKKAAPSEMFADSVDSQEPSKSKSEPGKSNDTSAAKDISKEIDADGRDEKVEAIEMIADSLCSEEPQKSMCEPEMLNNSSAANDISKEADAIAEDDGAKQSLMIADSLGSEEAPLSETKPEKSHYTSAASDNSKENDLNAQYDKAELSDMIADSVGSKKPQQSKTKSKRSKKRKGRKSIHAKRSAKPLKPEVSVRMVEVVDTPDHQDNTKDADKMQSEDPAVVAIEGADNEKSFESLIPSPKTSSIERGDTSSPFASESPTARQGKKKKGTINEGETASKVDTNMENDAKSKKKDIGSEIKQNKRSSKKASSVSNKEESVPDATDDMEEDDSDELDGNSTQGLAKRTEVGGSQRTITKKQGHAKPTTAKPGRKTPAKDEKKKTAGSLKSTPKATQDESDEEEILKSSYKRKRVSEEKKATKTKVYGAELVGARVEVLWPDDEIYYEGVVESFDSSKKKHKVVYEDGDIEVLDLRKENWKLINIFEAHTSEGESSHESADTDEVAEVEKAKTSVGAEKRRKTASSAKKSGASSSKSKAAPISGSKQDTSKITSKLKEEASTKAGKSGSKLFKGTPKSPEESEDDTVPPKVSSRTKQDMSKSASKSKGKTPKSGGKVKGGTSTKYDDTDDETSEFEKAPEKSKGKSQSTPKSKKSSKKRKRSGKK